MFLYSWTKVTLRDENLRGWFGFLVDIGGNAALRLIVCNAPCRTAQWRHPALYLDAAVAVRVPEIRCNGKIENAPNSQTADIAVIRSDL
jgi:hypothetical protein